VSLAPGAQMAQNWSFNFEDLMASKSRFSQTCTQLPSQTPPKRSGNVEKGVIVFYILLRSWLDSQSQSYSSYYSSQPLLLNNSEPKSSLSWSAVQKKNIETLKDKISQQKNRVESSQEFSEVRFAVNSILMG
jgi:hypothetical protein